MSRIKCDYCGSIFEYSSQTNCPSCGASLGDNSQILEMQERLRQEREKRKDVGRTGSVPEGNRAGRIVLIAAVLIIVCAIITAAVIQIRAMREAASRTNEQDDPWQQWEEQLPEEPAEPENVEAAFGETAEAGNCRAVCSAVRDYESEWYETMLDSGEEKHLSFRFTITNTGDSDLFIPVITAVYINGEGLRVQLEEKICNDTERGRKLSYGWLRPGNSVEGWQSFTLPKDANNIVLEVGEHICITIPDIDAVKAPDEGTQEQPDGPGA